MYKLVLTAFLAGAFLLLSCHKSAHAPTNCRISAIKVTGNGFSSSYLLSYNDSGALSVVNYTDGSSSWSRHFTYTGNLIVCNTTGSSTRIDTVFLNGSGKVDHIIDWQSPSYVTTTWLSYDNSGQLSTLTLSSGSTTPLTSNYVYSGGDIAEVDQSNSTIVYTYYTDKPVVAGGMIELGQWLNYGVLYMRNAHLVKAYGYGSADEPVTYTFDGGGKITTMVSGSGSGATTFNYTYDCH